MLNKIKDFLNNETGSETVEYVAIATVIIVTAATTYTTAIPGLITSGFAALTGFIAP